MKTLKLLEQVAINNSNYSTYQAMTFDGDFYYFCVEGRKTIDVYDLCFNKVKICNVNNEYGCITYNSNQKVFFAVPKYNANVIVKLDKKMQEIGYIDISKLFCEEVCITSISYSCIEDDIILSTKNKVYMLSLKCNTICELLVLENTTLLKVISVDPGYILITEHEDMYKILIYDCELNIVNELNFNKSSVLLDALFNPCELNSNNKCEQYFTIYFLMKADKSCSKLYQVPISYNEFEYDLCECNFNICTKPPKECEEISTSCLIETIALIQAAIAHILNAEGEKIQKVVATSNNIQEILCVNKEVEQMVVKVTHLEQVLYDSLVELKDFNCCTNSCNSCCDKENKCICDIDGGKVK